MVLLLPTKCHACCSTLRRAPTLKRLPSNPLPLAFQSLSSGFFSTRAAQETPAQDTSSLQSFKTGRVFSYHPTKFFGFIVPDDAILPWGDTNIFVHRHGLLSTLAPDRFPSFPMLRADERVRYQVQIDDKGRQSARDVTLQDGTPIPPLRSDFLWRRRDKAVKQLAQHVLHLVEQSRIPRKKSPNKDEEKTENEEKDAETTAETNVTTTSQDQDDEKLRDAIFQAYHGQYQTAMQEAHELIERVGMPVSDFNLFPSSRERKQDFSWEMGASQRELGNELVAVLEEEGSDPSQQWKKLQDLLSLSNQRSEKEEAETEEVASNAEP